MQAAALPLLAPEEEPVLGFWIEAGVLASAALSTADSPPARGRLEEIRSLGERAMERMTRSNIRLVYYWIARSWRGRDTGGLDVEDLAAVGVEGLIHAVWMWDYRRGLKFSTYASIWIRQYLTRAVTRARGSGLTAGEVERLEELFRTRVVLEIRLGRAASVRELADALQVTTARVRDLLLLERNVRFTVRLDQLVDHDTTTTVGDLMVDPAPSADEVLEHAELHAELAVALGRLTPRERAVLTARVGWVGPVLSEADVAARFGVTIAQVRATTQGALARLRQLLENGPLLVGAAA